MESREECRGRYYTTNWYQGYVCEAQGWCQVTIPGTIEAIVINFFFKFNFKLLLFIFKFFKGGGFGLDLHFCVILALCT